MTYHPDIHHRRSLRLQNYDYAQAGAYFVTVCTQDRVCLFGEVIDGVMVLNDAGKLVQHAWTDIPTHAPDADVDAFIVMPNHIHGIIILTNTAPVGAGLVPAPDAPAKIVPTHHAPVRNAATTDRATTRVAPTGLGGVVGAFKSRVTVEYIRGVKDHDLPPFSGRVWQRNYYEHIIRNEDSLNRIRDYIINNPLQWALDRENPANAPGSGRT